MKKKQLLLLVGVFGVLLAYVLITQSGDKGFNTITLPEIETIASDDMTDIGLQTPAQLIQFKKADADWNMTAPFEFPADKSKLESLTRLLSELRITDMISENPETEADFGLNSLAAKTITIRGKEDKTVTVVLGKVSATGSHTFAKLPGDSKIYQVLGNFDQQFRNKAADWRSLAIFSFEKDNANRFTIAMKKKKVLEVAKNEVVEEKIVTDTPANVTPTALPSKVVWQAKDQDQALSDHKINQFLGSLATLKAAYIVDEPEWKGKPLAVISVHTVQKRYDLEILKFNKEDKRYLVKRSKDDVYYDIPEYQGKNILKQLNDFKN